MKESTHIAAGGNDIVDTIGGMDPILLRIACTLYSTSTEELVPLSGGHYNAVFQYPLSATQGYPTEGKAGAQEFGILRIGKEDCPASQTLAMLDWVDFLAQNGAPVSAPVRSVNNHLMESMQHYGTRYVVTACEKAEGVLAETIPASEWNARLFQSIGKAAGRLHRISAGYKTRKHAYTRPLWYETNAVTAAAEKLAGITDPAGEKLARLIDELKQLPRTAGDFGLIHDDLHFANFLVHPDGEVTIIDFDDCAYGWYAMDVAMALFDVLVLHHSSSEAEQQSFGREFISNYLLGYKTEFELALSWQNRIPLFLKLKEICIYASLMGHPDIGHLDSWVGSFMDERSRRIAQDVPYVNIDLGNL